NYNVTVSVTDKDGDTSTSAAVAVNVASVTTATHFSVSAPSAATRGIAVGFAVIALDSHNKPGTNYAGTRPFSHTDSSALLPADTTLVDGAGSFFATLNSVATQTFTATDKGNASIRGTSDPITVSAPATGNKNTYVQQLFVDLLHRIAEPTGQQY